MMVDFHILEVIEICWKSWAPTILSHEVNNDDNTCSSFSVDWVDKAALSSFIGLFYKVINGFHCIPLIIKYLDMKDYHYIFFFLCPTYW